MHSTHTLTSSMTRPRKLLRVEPSASCAVFQSCSASSLQLQSQEEGTTLQTSTWSQLSITKLLSSNKCHLQSMSKCHQWPCQCQEFTCRCHLFTWAPQACTFLHQEFIWLLQVFICLLQACMCKPLECTWTCQACRSTWKLVDTMLHQCTVVLM